MVIAALSVLSVLVIEFTYVAQVNQKMAYDSLDQIKAHYTAKSAFKLSLLRLKAYQTVKSVIKSAAGGGGGGFSVPQRLLDQIWSFPFSFPFPIDLPGMTIIQKDEIKKFQNDSGIAGEYQSMITAESTRYNLNLMLANYNPLPTPTPSPISGSNGSGPQDPAASGTASAQPAPRPSPEALRQGMAQFLAQLLTNKFDSDQDFRDQYRDVRVEDLMDQILDWADNSYASPRGRSDDLGPKRAPFYSITELNMIPLIDDDLYELFSGSLTVAPTSAINVNKLTGTMLKALFPLFAEEDVKRFFEFRDDQQRDNSFKTVDDFYKAIEQFSGAYAGSRLEELKKDFANRGVSFATDETHFRVRAQAKVNGSVRVIEAQVTLMDPSTTNGSTPPRTGTLPPIPGSAQTNSTGAIAPPPATGLKITFMRII